MHSLTLHLNNGEKLILERPARSGNIDTLARQISECGLVHSVDTGGFEDEAVRYTNGKCEGFTADLGGGE